MSTDSNGPDAGRSRSSRARLRFSHRCEGAGDEWRASLRCAATSAASAEQRSSTSSPQKSVAARTTSGERSIEWTWTPECASADIARAMLPPPRPQRSTRCTSHASSRACASHPKDSATMICTSSSGCAIESCPSGITRISDWHCPPSASVRTPPSS
eukprot:7389304-Prymnesium_polylepis.1